VQEKSDNWQEAQHTRMQEGGDNWKEATNACREGRPNDNRVRVFVRFLCKWMKSPIDINIDTKVSYKSSERFAEVELYYCCRVEIVSM
jgi:hypothetical protein